MLFAFEGPDEVGKTSLAQALSERLRHSGLRARYVALPGHVPGTLGHHVYALHHNPSAFGLQDLDQTSVQLLHLASHADQLNRVICPALDRREIVVLDRYWWSAPVYANAFGVPEHIVSAISNFQRVMWRNAMARAVFLVHRGQPLTDSISSETFRRLRSLYEDFSAAAPDEAIIRIDNDADLDSAATAVFQAAAAILGEPADSLVHRGAR